MDGRTARGNATRAAILAASADIIARDGAASLTQRRAAAAAATSLAAVTYHFRTLNDLLTAVFTESARKATADIEFLRNEVLAGRLGLIDACTAMAEKAIYGSPSYAVLMAEAAVAAARNPALQAVLLETGTAREALFVGHVAQPGWERGLSCAFDGAILRALSRGDAADRAALRDVLTSICDAFGVA